MPTSRSKLAADAWGALLKVHASLVPTLDRRLRTAAGIPLGWYDVLLELQAAPERRLTMTQLGERVVLSRTRVSRVVDELARDGLVRREPHPQDARSAFAVLTDDGYQRFRRAAPLYLAGIEQEFAEGLTERELHQLAAVLDRVNARVRNSS
jgi:DNA-binding MarR family transcriptional regulator